MIFMLDTSNLQKVQWIVQAVKSKEHLYVILFFSAMCAFSTLFTPLVYVIPIIFFIYSICISFNKIIKYMLISIAITLIASLIHPFLGVVVSIVFFIRRLAKFGEQIHGIMAGILVYVFPFLISFFCYNLISLAMYYGYHSSLIFILLVVLGVSALYLHVILVWLYNKGYTTKTAINTMTLAPLILILFVVPFIINLGSWLTDGIENNFDLMEDDMGESPDLHEVSGHYRTLENGEVTYVNPHVRTNPNGIESDNLSFKK